MHRFTVVLGLAALTTPLHAQRWTPQAADSSTEYRGLHAVSSQVAWAAGRGGAWAQTTDGQHWRTGRIRGAEQLFGVDVHAWDARRAVVLATHFDGGVARIYRTENGGASWRPVFEDARPGAFWDGLAFLDASRGVAFGDPVNGAFALATSGDGGRTWALVPGDSLPRPLPDEAAYAASGTAITARGGTVWIGTGGGRVARVLRSTDGGRRWSAAETPLPGGAGGGIFGLAFRDSRRGVAVGGNFQRASASDGNLAVTTDGGRTWRRLRNTGLVGVQYGVTHVAAGSYVSTGPGGSFQSDDDGATWRRISSEGFNTSTFAGSLSAGWAAGTGGRVAGYSATGTRFLVPSLVVLVAIDQFLPEYLDRWADQWTGGFARLRSEGLVYPEGRQDHAITATAPGHSTMLSGRVPASTGIASNSLDTRAVDWPLLWGTGPGASPEAFRGTALYDWLLARDSTAKVFSVSTKDRSAILPVGRARGSVFWWAGRGFSTSTWYASELPAWVKGFNARPGIRALAGRTWNLLLPASSYAEPDSQPWERAGREVTFPHRIPADTAGFRSQVHHFPWADSLTLSLALEGVRETRLGQGRGTDLLSVGLSATDYVGHDFGPDSREVHDHLLRLDRWLGVFLDSLRTLAPGDVVVAVTSDHGVQPYPERERSLGRPGGRLATRAWLVRQRDSLVARWGTDFGLRFDTGLLLADLSALRARGVDVDAFTDRMAAAMRGMEGVAAAWTPRTLAAAQVTDSAAGYWRRTLPPTLEWAVALQARPGWVWFESPNDADHGTSSLADRRVPVIFWGAGVTPARCTAVVRTVDIGPTLAQAVDVSPTEPVDGRALPLDRCVPR